ncbi:MAG: L,D-transpeptidase [Muribaculaceae bacterium]|nr:L,D-transpeptidase [Muribaculaceae bacterium]
MRKISIPQTLHIILYGVGIFLCLTSCSSGAKQQNEDSIPTNAVSDYEALEKDTVEEKPAPAPKKWFANATDAINYMKESGEWERYEKGILPQMAKDELSYATRLLNNQYDGFIVVDKSRMKVIRFNKYGEEVVSYGMACARNFGTKHDKRDNRTPEGFFSVRSVHDSTDWQFVDDDGVKSEKKGEFGPRFIRLAIPGWYSIGIHGTCAPWSIGGRRSHGCIRVKNENIMQLIEMVEPGMPVIVSPGKKDMAVNLEEGYEIPAISTVPGQGAPKLSEAAKKAALANREKNKNMEDSIATPKMDSIQPETPTIVKEKIEVVNSEPDSIPVEDPHIEGN